jgi:phytoene/squalene synthetase
MVLLRFSALCDLCGDLVFKGGAGEALKAAEAAVQEMVRKADHSNYLCTLLLDPAIRKTAFAIQSFNAEVAQIRSVCLLSSDLQTWV